MAGEVGTGASGLGQDWLGAVRQAWRVAFWLGRIRHGQEGRVKAGMEKGG